MKSREFRKFYYFTRKFYYKKYEEFKQSGGMESDPMGNTIYRMFIEHQFYL